MTHCPSPILYNNCKRCLPTPPTLTIIADPSSYRLPPYQLMLVPPLVAAAAAAFLAYTALIAATPAFASTAASPPLLPLQRPRLRFHCSAPASTAASPPSLPLQRPHLRFHCSVIAVFAAAYTSLRHPNQTLAPSKRPACRYNGTCAQDILRTTAYANAAQRHYPHDAAITNVTTAGTNKPTPQSHSCRQNKQ